MRLHRWYGFGRRKASVTMPDVKGVAGPRKEENEDEGVVLPVVEAVAGPWSPLESEAERDEGVKLDVDWDRSKESLVAPSTAAGNFADAGRSAESLLPRDEQAAGGEAEEDVQQQTPSMLQSPENPLRDLQEACARSPNFTPASKSQKQVITDIPAIQEPEPSSFDEDDDESSDSWTGDDEFLPRSARRQKRIDRKASPLPKKRRSSSSEALNTAPPAPSAVVQESELPLPFTHCEAVAVQGCGAVGRVS